MVQKLNLIFDEVLERIKPSKEELTEIKDTLNLEIGFIKKRLGKLKIDADVFVGGSFAKNTLIRKDKYDIDIFLRFSNSNKEDLSQLAEKVLGKRKNVSCVHGSRDYFRINKNAKLYFEIIPVLKIKNSKEAENITDLSYSHVKYVNKKTNQKILDEIMLAKAFCHAVGCYGAESYIRGFSGYALELLVIYYKSFLKFARVVSKMKEQVIIDIEKNYKNKQEVLMDLNSSKLSSPIVLIDPTYPQRNALAGLSVETFEKFKKSCIEFLKNPSIKLFEKQKIDLDKIKNKAKKNNNEFILLEVKTRKQEGDIAGSKLLKFYKNFILEIEKYFTIKNKGFNYSGKKSARYFFVVKSKKEIIFDGPFLGDEKNILKFKKEHKGKTYIKGKRIFARRKIDFGIDEFVKNYKKKNKKKIKEMYIEGLRVI